MSATWTARCVVVPSTPPITAQAPRSYTVRVTSPIAAAQGLSDQDGTSRNGLPGTASRVLLLEGEDGAPPEVAELGVRRVAGPEPAEDDLVDVRLGLLAAGAAE